MHEPAAVAAGNSGVEHALLNQLTFGKRSSAALIASSG